MRSPGDGSGQTAAARRGLQGITFRPCDPVGDRQTRTSWETSAAVYWVLSSRAKHGRRGNAEGREIQRREQRGKGKPRRGRRESPGFRFVDWCLLASDVDHKPNVNDARVVCWAGFFHRSLCTTKRSPQRRHPDEILVISETFQLHDDSIEGISSENSCTLLWPSLGFKNKPNRT